MRNILKLNIILDYVQYRTGTLRVEKCYLIHALLIYAVLALQLKD